MVKKILGLLAVVIAVLVVVVATRPDAYHVERSIDISAPAPVIFPAVADLKAMGEWSPWDKRDPAMKKTYSDATTGVGASYAWEGNKQVGKGKMTVVESRAPERVANKLEFIEPFPSVADTAMDLKPSGPTSTHVTWSMDGKSNFIGKAFSLYMSMDKAIGPDFEAGLASLKTIAEAKQAALVKEAAEREAAAKAAAAAAVAAAPAPDAKAAPNAPKAKKK
jgi:hypothetical protein